MQPAVCRPLHDAGEELLAPCRLAILWAYMGGLLMVPPGPGSVATRRRPFLDSGTCPQASNAGGQFPQAPAARPRGERSAGTDAPAAPSPAWWCDQWMGVGTDAPLRGPGLPTY